MTPADPTTAHATELLPTPNNGTCGMDGQTQVVGSGGLSLAGRYRDTATTGLLSDLEAWCWDRTELDADLEHDPDSWNHPEDSRAFVDVHIEAITSELQRRDRLRLRPTAPAWPDRWPDLRTDAMAIKDALPIPAYLDRRKVALQQRGERLWARCPLPGHEEDTPSFVVYPGDRGWYCFGCQRGGDLFALHMYLTGDDNFATATTELAAEAFPPGLSR